MKINLAYGKTGLMINLPDRYNADVIEPVWIKGIHDQELAIKIALRNPYHSRPLKDIIDKDDSVGIIFSDITRATPYNVILPPLLDELRLSSVRDIVFFCANGTHRLLTKKELEGILGEYIADNYEIVQNIASGSELFDCAGTTSSGNDILINRRLMQCKIKILTGFIEPHFFAGFSGGAKALIPGMASEKTIKHNHSIAHLSNANARWGITDGNPLWEEIMEAAGFIPGMFLLNITMNKNKEITNVFAGDLRRAHSEGCKFVRESAMVPVKKLYDIVITTNSGYPLDLNVYQTVKGMSAAAQVVKEGGHIIVAAECWDGIPSGSDYEKILLSVSSPGELMRYIRENEGSLKDTWQIYFQALIQQKAHVYLYSDKLDRGTIKKTLLDPVTDIAGLTEEIARKTGPGTTICVLPEGPQTIPYHK